jgi:hypothetical protein
MSCFTWLLYDENHVSTLNTNYLQHCINSRHISPFHIGSPSGVHRSNATLSQHNSVTTQHNTTLSQHKCHNITVTTLSQHNTVTTQSQHNTVTTQHCHNTKCVKFQERLLKVLKCYSFLWVQWWHNCSPAASFVNCVMTL